MPYRWKFVSSCYGDLCPWRCTGGGICGVINNFGSSRSLLITVWNSVNDTLSVQRTSTLHLCDMGHRIWAYCNCACTKQSPNLTDPTLTLTLLTHFFGWLRGTVVERRSLAGKPSLFCAGLVADGWPLIWVNRPL